MTSKQSRVAARLLVPLLASVAGCSADGNGTTAGDMNGTPATGCAALRDTCLTNQMACVEQGGAATCQPCPTGQYATLEARCAPLDGTPLTHDFPMFTTQPGEEVLGTCRSWSLGNATELWVSAVELTQDEASHHSNWTFSPTDKYPGPDGLWRCSERRYDQLSAALAGGVLYAQSTQATHEVQHFPNGAAVRIPPWSRVISAFHLLNVTPAPVTGHARVTIYTLPASDVKVKLTPIHITFEALDIAAHATVRHTADCEAGLAFRSAVHGPWDLQLYYLLPHTHALGSRVLLQALGGAIDGKTLLDVRGYDAGAHGRAFDPPFDLTDADGLRFACEFTNPRDEDVHWGFGDQEMCELLGFGASVRAFESIVSQLMPAASDGATQVVTGPCANVILPWDSNKPGGSGP